MTNTNNHSIPLILVSFTKVNLLIRKIGTTSRRVGREKIVRKNDYYKGNGQSYRYMWRDGKWGKNKVERVYFSLLEANLPSSFPN